LLQARGLSLWQEKTSITHIENRFDFPGQNVGKCHGNLLIKPSKKNVPICLDTIRQIIKDHKQATAGQLICLLNPVIGGWAGYQRHVVSKKIFACLDRAISDALRWWAIRRHPRKSKHSSLATYIRAVAGQQWSFYGEVEGGRAPLLRAWRVSIERHTKVNGAANPFDPQGELSFERRLGSKMDSSLKGQPRLLRLWKAQNGICPVCDQKLTALRGWRNHHVVWRSMGGRDVGANRVLLHPTCQQHVHSQKGSVSKPRPAGGEREA
jgi:RNA-directed DNA polymerase